MPSLRLRPRSTPTRRSGSGFRELLEALDRAADVAADSPAMVELNQEWQECMGQAGYDTEPDPESQRFAFYAERDALVADWVGDGANPADVEVVDPALARQILAIEVPVAVASATRRDATAYDGRAEQILWRIEQKVLDDHADQVAELLASLPAAS